MNHLHTHTQKENGKKLQKQNQLFCKMANFYLTLIITRISLSLFINQAVIITIYNQKEDGFSSFCEKLLRFFLSTYNRMLRKRNDRKNVLYLYFMQLYKASTHVILAGDTVNFYKTKITRIKQQIKLSNWKESCIPIFAFI